MQADVPPAWPQDPGHSAAVDTLLLMAAAEDQWGDTYQALRLLDNAERIVGPLPAPYRRLQSRCRDVAERTPGT